MSTKPEDSKLAEATVLGTAMEDQDCLLLALDRLKPEHFGDPFHAAIFRAMRDLFTAGTRPASPEVMNALDRSGDFATQVRQEAFTWITQQVVLPDNYGYWLEEVRSAALRREGQALLARGMRLLAEEPDVHKAFAHLENEFFALAGEQIQRRIISPTEAAEAAKKRLEERRQNPATAWGLLTGFRTFDEATMGLKPGDLVIIAGYTGHGKTTLAMNLARNLAIDKTATVLYLNTEMFEAEMSDKLGAILAGIEHHKVATGALARDELAAVMEAYERYGKSRLWNSEVYALAVSEVGTIARQFKLQHGLDVLFLDYIGRLEMDMSTSRVEKEYQFLERTARHLKSLAQQLQIAIVCLAQLNEEHQLAGAKGMAREADLLVRILPMSEEERAKHGHRANMWLEVTKARRGPTGTKRPVLFEKAKLRMTEVE